MFSWTWWTISCSCQESKFPFNLFGFVSLDLGLGLWTGTWACSLKALDKFEPDEQRHEAKTQTLAFLELLSELKIMQENLKNILRWLNLRRLSAAVFQSMGSKVTLMRAGAHLGMTMSLATKWIQSFCIETTHLWMVRPIFSMNSILHCNISF